MFRPKTGATRQLVENVTGAEFGTIPEAVREIGKMAILDALGCMLAGTRQDSSKKVLRFTRSQGGVEECTVIGFGGRTNRYHSTLVNGALCHAWEFDDAMGGGLSCESAVVPASLAVAERELRGGHHLLVGVILGWETMARIASAATWVPDRRPLDPLGTFGPFGAAVAAGKVLEFDAFDMENAISICTAQAAASLQAVQTGGEIARLHGGFASSYGVRCAYMAQEGLSGARQILEGNMGFFQCVCGLHDDDRTPRYDVDLVNEGFGTSWLMERVTFKNRPVGAGQLSALDALAKLQREGPVNVDEIERVEIAGNPSSGGWMDTAITVPPDDDTYAAQRSLVWGAGTALVVGDNTIQSYLENSPPYGASARIRSVVDRIHVVADHERLPLFSHRVTITLRNGKTMEATQNAPRGNVRENPMSWEDLETKFRGQADFGGLSRERQDRVIAMAHDLENVIDVRELTKQLVIAG